MIYVNLYLKYRSIRIPVFKLHNFNLQEEKIDSSLEFLILASDGLWDVVSNEVCKFFHFFNANIKLLILMSKSEF